VSEVEAGVSLLGLSLELAPSGGWGTSAIPPLSGDEQTSGEPVAIGAFDPDRTDRIFEGAVPSLCGLATAFRSHLPKI
jgi:hypothetical protein